jgi:hypothetical protein
MARCAFAAVLVAACAMALPVCGARAATALSVSAGPLLALTPAAPPQDPADAPPVIERFTANVRVCESGECTRFLDDATAYGAALDLLVYRWTTADEAAALWTVLGTRGWHAFAAALEQRAPAAVLHEFRHVPAGFRQAYPLQLATTRPAAGNRRIVSFLGIYDDNEVRCFSLDLDASGAGAGTIAVALAAVAVDGDSPFLCAGVDRTAPLSHVRAWPPEE